MRSLIALLLVACSAPVSTRTQALSPAQTHYQAGQPVSNLWIGDSTIKGSTTAPDGTDQEENGGYRLAWVERAETDGVQVKMLGTLVDGPPALTNGGLAYHEGRGGWLCGTAADTEDGFLYDKTPEMLANARIMNGGADPDLAELGCGTNEIGHRIALEVPPADYSVTPVWNTLVIALPFDFWINSASISVYGNPLIRIYKNGALLVEGVDWNGIPPSPSTQVQLAVAANGTDVYRFVAGDSGVTDRIGGVVDQILANTADTDVMVLTPPPMVHVGAYAYLDWFDRNVRLDLAGMVQRKNDALMATGKRARVHAAITWDYEIGFISVDGLHPMQEGYVKGLGCASAVDCPGSFIQQVYGVIGVQ